MADEDWNDAEVSMEAAPAPALAEMPEIKLYGKWSCDDVQVRVAQCLMSWALSVFF